VSTGDVYSALFAFQGEAPAVAKGAFNPFHKSKYATLPAIWGEIQPLLQKNGLVLHHTLRPCDGGSIDVEAVLYHVPSRSQLASRVTMPLSKPDAQSVGSACTYARRYTTCALLNLQVDEDDDGNKASGVSEKKGYAVKPVEPTTTQTVNLPTEAAQPPAAEVGIEDICRTFVAAIDTVDGLKKWFKENSKGLSAEDKATLKRVLSERKKEIEDGAGSE